MTHDFNSHMTAALDWVGRLREAGWLSDSLWADVGQLEQNDAATLFEDETARPLVIGLFGGTGVGKSSLLNRLADAPIAKVGVERPTSREATLYLHEDAGLQSLPESLPLERTTVKRHAAEAWRGVAWLDAPDIDSVEEANRTAVMAWLPYVDLVAYVVSPERYRDDVGWRVLGERAARHGWLFLMNHWDTGVEGQVEDFAALLRSGGFDDAVILKTSCAAAAVEDDFEQLTRIVHDLLDQHAVRELTRLGQRARLAALRGVLQKCAATLGDAERWRRLAGVLQEAWAMAEARVNAGLAYGAQGLAVRLAAREEGLLQSARRRVFGADAAKETPAGPDPAEMEHLTERLWEPWVDDTLLAAAAEVERAAHRERIAPGPLRQRLEADVPAARPRCIEHMRVAVRTSLAAPGVPAQRAARRVTGFLMAFLPLGAVLWVTVQLVSDFAAASRNQNSYPGIDFAISAGLLVLFAWLVPFTLDRLLKPSMHRTVLQAIRTGLAQGLEETRRELLDHFDEQRVEAAQLAAEGDELLKQTAVLLIRPIRTDQATLSRIIARRDQRPAPGGRSRA